MALEIMMLRLVGFLTLIDLAKNTTISHLTTMELITQCTLRVTHHKGSILQEDHYYPFGMNISALSSTAPLAKPNKYKYNGNEEQLDFNWNIYDFNARLYDAQIGRFGGVDPLADSQESWNPYHFSYDNPVVFSDPTGLEGHDNVQSINSQLDWSWMSDGGAAAYNEAEAYGDWARINDVDEPGPMPESEKGYDGKPKVKFFHVSDQQVINALLLYFQYLSDNGMDVGNLDHVFDFNYYRRKSSFTRWLNRKNENFEEYVIDNAYASTGQNIPQNDGLIEGRKAKVMIMAALNRSSNNYGNRYVYFNFSEDVYFREPEEDKRIVGKHVYYNRSIRFQRANPNGSISNNGDPAIVINFYTNDARNAFYNKYIKNKGKEADPNLSLKRSKY